MPDTNSNANDYHPQSYHGYVGCCPGVGAANRAMEGAVLESAAFPAAPDPAYPAVEPLFEDCKRELEAVLGELDG